MSDWSYSDLVYRTVGPNDPHLTVQHVLDMISRSFQNCEVVHEVSVIVTPYGGRKVWTIKTSIRSGQCEAVRKLDIYAEGEAVMFSQILLKVREHVKSLSLALGDVFFRVGPSNSVTGYRSVIAR